jgi:hypothetical protein
MAGLLAATTIAASAAFAAPSASAAGTPVQVGLFGTQDPTYDGVFRQSLSLLAFAASGEAPPQESVDWLLGQQCDDGGFQAFRADTSKPCTKSDPVRFVGEDSNSTALASAALTVLGELDSASGALGWLEAAQNADGGFPYFLGGTSDVNSTAIALLATNAVGLAPTQVARDGASAADYLVGLQIGCPGVATNEDGGFAYADFSAGTANDSASVQAALAITGAALPFAADPPALDIPRAECPAPTAAPAATATAAAPASTPAAAAAVTPSSAELAGGYVARTLETYGNAIPQLDYATGERKPGTVSAGDTAWAVLALSAIGVGGTQRDAALDVLLGEVGGGAARASAAAVSDETPGLLSLAALAVVSADGSQATVERLVARVGATMRTAPTSVTPTPTPTSPTPGPSGTSNGGLAPSGASPLTPGLAGAGVLLLLLGSVALGLTSRQGSHS